MLTTDELESVITKCHIIKSFCPLPESTLGYYYYDGDYYCILINESIRNDERLYRIVLAEEIGHYRTTIGDITPRKYMCYRDRLLVDKKELQALRWATDLLIPTDTLLKIIREKTASTVQELIDYFFVTYDFFMHKLDFMAKQKDMWDIDEERVLCLYNLPSVFIHQKPKL
ncbi:ImmA/IrrE family metallo-endopeptidase [Geosporobacter ferrireducens]|uniref:Peptidase n=1 Tax=Geosporobacter ferrireducens TaxID=1424294 RepID=A0A1D8GBU3_9FIRM|nr:ImmA/IrrE family metallo-endopeptidase [Geosporobacter ferrireducens]AOT68374.1 peptidase [Geosporobacter ferrireducens]MTI53821.1 ImmA/IrrE family metallo-endopeptidase [Geosporobacter ferrireducens]